MNTTNEHRAALAGARRVVVKIGSRVLVQRTGKPDLRRMRALVKDFARIRRDGRDVVIVSSGAIGAGLEALGLKTRPTNLPDLQMAAAIGQTRLMTRYDKLFAQERLRVAQVLLTHDDLNARRRHLNARNTMMSLLRRGVVPIVNENDVVSVDEIKLGDNDILAALVTHLIQADLLILLSVTDGLREPTPSGRTRRVPHLAGISAEAKQMASGTLSHLSVGGMATKLQAAEEVTRTGAVAVIADGRKAGTIRRILKGDDVGTLVTGPGSGRRGRAMAGRKRWIAFFHRSSGTLVIDAGARNAILQNGKSLLPIGVRAVEGKFKTGDVINIKTKDGELVARGLAEYSGEEVEKIKGHRTSEIKRLLGSKDYDEVVHRDNMVILSDSES